MDTETGQLEIGQRVHINEEDEPAFHVGKMATIEAVKSTIEGVSIYDVRTDNSNELISLPQQYLKPITIIPSSLFANDLSLPWDPQAEQRSRTFTDNNWLAAHILETLLFYNKIVVPTVDYSIIVPLIHWLSIPLFKELLESGSLSFVRTSGSLAYIGNGVGLAMIEIRPFSEKGNEKEKKKKEEQEQWWIKIHRCDPKEAVILQLQNRLNGIQNGLIDTLGKFVEICTVETSLPQFTEKVARETYRDIQGSEVLTNYFFKRNPSINKISLNLLPGIEPNQTRMFHRLPLPAVAGDEIDTTLRLAMLNLESYMAEECGARDAVMDSTFIQLLNAKAHRYTGGNIAHDSFTKLLTIEEIPNVVSSIMSGEISPAQVWKFRNTRVANEFRQWFDQLGPDNPDVLVSEYIKSLKSGGLLSSWEGKALRFIALQAIGASLIPLTSGLSFIASMGLSAVDCFLLDKIRMGFKPRYYINELRNLFPK